MRTILLALIVVLGLSTPALSQELVVNGGFETPVVGFCNSGNFGNWCLASSASVPGWTVEWVSNNEPGLLEFWRGLTPPHSGFQNVELDSTAPVRIYQDLATCPGATYTLSYAWRKRTTGVEVLEVQWGDMVIAKHSDSVFTFTPVVGLQIALSGTTRVAFADIGNADALGILLDSVSVTGPNRLLPNGCTAINIKPNSNPNSINLSSGGVVPVTIWGSADFDVRTIDPAQLSFMSAQVKTVGKTARILCSIQDSGSPDPSEFDSIGAPDGYDDLTCHFSVQDISGLDDTSTSAEVKALVCTNGFVNGCPPSSIQLTFSDSVNIVRE